MPRVSEMFPSKFLKAADLQGQAHVLVMDRLEYSNLAPENQPEDMKWVLFFQGKDRGLVLNVTNTKRLGEIHGEDTDDWSGKEIVLYPDKTDLKGQMVDCIRVRANMEVSREEVPF